MTDNGDLSNQLSLGQLPLGDFDIVDVVPIPVHGDHMVRLRTIEEALEDLDSQDGAVGYLIQVRPKRAYATPQSATAAATPQQSSQKPLVAENIYLPDGKLNVPYLAKSAELLLAKGDFPLARNIFKAILQSGERTAMAYFGIARCFEAEGRIDDAIFQYEEAIAYQPSLEAYRQLSGLLIRKKKDQEAAELMERALNIKEIPPSARLELHRNCSSCWSRLNRVQDAERHLLRAIEFDPASDELRSNLGAVYLQAGKTFEARRQFQEALISNPRSDKGLTGLATCHLAEGDKRAAHDAFVRSLEIQVNNPQAIFLLVKLAYELKIHAPAARILEEYIQIAPVNGNVLYSLAGLHFHLGRIEDAKRTASRILELMPQHAGAKELLSMIERY